MLDENAIEVFFLCFEYMHRSCQFSIAIDLDYSQIFRNILAEFYIGAAFDFHLEFSKEISIHVGHWLLRLRSNHEHFSKQLWARARGPPNWIIIPITQYSFECSNHIKIYTFIRRQYCFVDFRIFHGDKNCLLLSVLLLCCCGAQL